MTHAGGCRTGTDTWERMRHIERTFLTRSKIHPTEGSNPGPRVAARKSPNQLSWALLAKGCLCNWKTKSCWCSLVVQLKTLQFLRLTSYSRPRRRPILDTMKRGRTRIQPYAGGGWPRPRSTRVRRDNHGHDGMHGREAWWRPSSIGLPSDHASPHAWLDDIEAPDVPWSLKLVFSGLPGGAAARNSWSRRHETNKTIHLISTWE
jgi:hypothetical protein